MSCCLANRWVSPKGNNSTNDAAFRAVIAEIPDGSLELRAGTKDAEDRFREEKICLSNSSGSCLQTEMVATEMRKSNGVASVFRRRIPIHRA
jgi:hypothetical protein